LSFAEFDFKIGAVTALKWTAADAGIIKAIEQEGNARFPWLSDGHDRLLRTHRPARKQGCRRRNA
jgi:hypothetical protein